ncbi:cell death in tomato 1 [Boeremia exigua]|uniref:cell death in tomato 1 n=1 Tax=Boeremia exigua TaxID=749465 RepID=UPI001E8CA3B2|nr:cell death in tomato 1 [Boeremia exigua]KAH6618754.1 cell death in tomato 1 [Boeremia exigua]
MRFLVTVFTSAALLGCSTSASPLEVRQDGLQPFEVTAVNSYSPSGRPGSDVWRHMRANITDPNSYFYTSTNRNLTVPGDSQGINCEARWYRGESPLDRTWPCDPAPNGHWALQVVSSGVYDFKLRFIHAVEPGLSWPNTRYEAEASFKSGENLIGRCLSSGSCSYSLGADCNKSTTRTPEWYP